MNQAMHPPAQAPQYPQQQQAAAPLPPPQPQPQPAGETLDLFQLLTALRRQWLIVAIATVLFTSLALFYALSLAPVYRATAEVLILPRQKNLFSDAPLGQVMASDILLVESQARLATSDTVLKRVVESQKLAEDPEFNGEAPAAGPLAALRRLLGTDAPRQPVADRELAALKMLRKRVEARRARKTFVVEIAVEAHDPEKAARLANAVAQAFIAEQAEAATGEAGKLASQLNERLSQLRREVEEAEARVAAYRQKHGIVATRNDQLETQARLARLGEELVKARTRMAAARARHDSLMRAIRAGGAAEALPEALTSPVLARLRAEYARAAASYSALRETLGPKHPQLLTARAEVERLKRLIREELRRLATRVRTEHETAKAEVAAIERNLQDLRNSTSRTGLKQVRLRALQREAEAKRKVFEGFLLKARETGEAQRIKLADARLISPAVPPQYPVRPRKKMILALAMLAGLGLGMALAILRDAAVRRRQQARAPQPPFAMPPLQAQATPLPPAPGAGHAQALPPAPQDAQMLQMAQAQQVAQMQQIPQAQQMMHTQQVAQAQQTPQAQHVPQTSQGAQTRQMAQPAAMHSAQQPRQPARPAPSAPATPTATPTAPGATAQAKVAAREPAMPLPLLGELPALSAHAPKLDVVLARAVEALLARPGAPGHDFGLAVRRVLHRLKGVRLLAVMAAEAGEGATVLAWSLALASVKQGRRVLLADMNPHHPALSKMLAGHDPALRAEILQERQPLDNLLVRDAELAFDFLPLAPLMRAGLDAARAGRLRRQLAELFSRYDLVVLDNAPLPVAEDDFGLAEMMDATVLVASGGQCHAPHVQEMAALLKAADMGGGLVCNEGAMPAGAGREAPRRNDQGPNLARPDSRPRPQHAARGGANPTARQKPLRATARTLELIQAMTGRAGVI